MMKLSTRTRYGLRAVVEMAQQGAWRRGQDVSRRVALGSIAEVQDIDPEYLKQIFVALRKAGIVQAVQGRAGGYVLSRAPKDISALDLAQALDEGTELVPCVDAPEDCDRSEDCPTHRLWMKVAEQVRRVLASTTVAKLARECPRRVLK